MNLWECSSPGCDCTSVGTGGAIGLRAIGWWFKVGKGLLCPRHRPDAGMKKHPTFGCKEPGPCSICTADQEADKLQFVIASHLNDDISFYRKQSTRWDT